jgi:hypothetical protein
MSRLDNEGGTSSTENPVQEVIQIDPDEFARALAYLKTSGRLDELNKWDMFRPGFTRRDLFHGERDGNTVCLYEFGAGEMVCLEVRGRVEEPIVHLTASEAEALGRELIARARIARSLEAIAAAEGQDPE